jgi:hypothetical protein
LLRDADWNSLSKTAARNLAFSFFEISTTGSLEGG